MFEKRYQLFFNADGTDGGNPAPAGGADPVSPVDNNGGQDGEAAPKPADTDNILLGGDNGGDKPADGDQQQDVQIPESYTFKLGEGMEIDDETSRELTAVGKELKLTQEGMDKLLELHNKVIAGLAVKASAERNANVEECHKQGLLDQKALGMTGAFIKTVGSEAALKALVESGVMYNPHVMKMFQSLAVLVNEDTGADGKPTPPEKSAADIIFSNSKYV